MQTLVTKLSAPWSTSAVLIATETVRFSKTTPSLITGTLFFFRVIFIYLSFKLLHASLSYLHLVAGLPVVHAPAHASLQKKLNY